MLARPRPIAALYPCGHRPAPEGAVIDGTPTERDRDDQPSLESLWAEPVLLPGQGPPLLFQGVAGWVRGHGGNASIACSTSSH